MARRLSGPWSSGRRPAGAALGDVVRQRSGRCTAFRSPGSGRPGRRPHRGPDALCMRRWRSCRGSTAATRAHGQPAQRACTGPASPWSAPRRWCRPMGPEDHQGHGEARCRSTPWAQRTPGWPWGAILVAHFSTKDMRGHRQNGREHLIRRKFDVLQREAEQGGRRPRKPAEPKRLGWMHQRRPRVAHRRPAGCS